MLPMTRPLSTQVPYICHSVSTAVERTPGAEGGDEGEVGRRGAGGQQGEDMRVRGQRRHGGDLPPEFRHQLPIQRRGLADDFDRHRQAPPLPRVHLQWSNQNCWWRSHCLCDEGGLSEALGVWYRRPVPYFVKFPLHPRPTGKHLLTRPKPPSPIWRPNASCCRSTSSMVRCGSGTAIATGADAAAAACCWCRTSCCMWAAGAMTSSGTDTTAGTTPVHHTHLSLMLFPYSAM